MTQVHQKPACELSALHAADGTQVLVEQWTKAKALNTSFAGKLANGGLGG